MYRKGFKGKLNKVFFIFFTNLLPYLRIFQRFSVPSVHWTLKNLQNLHWALFNLICKYTHFWADSGYTRKYRFIFGLPALILIVILPVTWEVPSPHYTTTAAEAAASPHFPLKWLFVHITRGAGGNPNWVPHYYLDWKSSIDTDGARESEII